MVDKRRAKRKKILQRNLRMLKQNLHNFRKIGFDADDYCRIFSVTMSEIEWISQADYTDLGYGKMGEVYGDELSERKGV